MKGLGRRWLGIVVGVVAVAMLSAVPAAQATGDTIKASAGIQFSGVVDNFPTCAPTSVTIGWGDGTSSAGSVNSSTGAVSGTHTYASQTTYSGTVTLFRCPGAAGQTTDTFTANVGPHPQFTQCPPVGADFGCQFLIVVSGSGTTILQDPNQGPYESADDSLIGIQNNSSGPISSVPLSTPGSALFGFETGSGSDGLCNPGSPPFPSGCQPPPGGAPGSCTGATSSNCSFPAPPGQPAGYTEPGNNAPNTQNGYEGPRNWYSAVSADQTSGRVNFSPALQPGESTYFSLEEPPSAQAIAVGSSPSGLISFPPTVSTNGARFSGTVNPNGSVTTAFFQYGLDARYTDPKKSGPVYNKSTPALVVGGDLSDHTFSQLVSNLVPNAVYHFRLVAKNKDGTSAGQDRVFTTKKAALPGTPAIGKNFNVSLVSGLVLIKVKGEFIPLTQLRQFPTGTEIDALKGALQLISATGQKHKTQNGTFKGAIFKIGQTRSGASKGLTTLTIVENAFKGAPSYSKCPRKAPDRPVAIRALSARVLQTLRGNAHGRFRTSGRFAAATVRGTDWGTVDRCDGTLTLVHRGTVSVSDFVHHITVIVTAGHQYLASRK